MNLPKCHTHITYNNKIIQHEMRKNGIFTLAATTNNWLNIKEIYNSNSYSLNNIKGKLVS